MTDEELIKRLRSLDVVTRHEAADRIEDLAQESNRRLDLARSEGVARVIQFERAEAAETKLAMAVDALQKLVKLDDDYSPFGGELLRDRVARTWEEARAVLAELEKTE